MADCEFKDGRPPPFCICENLIETVFQVPSRLSKYHFKLHANRCMSSKVIAFPVIAWRKLALFSLGCETGSGLPRYATSGVYSDPIFGLFRVLFLSESIT